MPRSNLTSLRGLLGDAGYQSNRSLRSTDSSVSLSDLARGSSLNGRLGELSGRSVLVSTTDQLAAALAVVELDGIARRLVLRPPDLSFEHLPFVMATTEIEAVVSDRTVPETGLQSAKFFVTCSPRIARFDFKRSASPQTEWVLLTSGTTGPPKMVVHTLATLAGAINEGTSTGSPAVWSTFYDIRRYGGLQIFFRALLGGGSLVLSSAQESPTDFLIRAGAEGVTHISGTPSHWRRALMSPSARGIAPENVRLSGEIADQTVLDNLRAFYPEAKVVHAFASTEAGLAFEVGDGLTGFPASLIGQRDAGVEMKVEDGSLRIRSARNAIGYLGSQGTRTLADNDGFVDTGDMVELCGDRYYFVGRRDGVINVGGLKVHPEEVEAVINRHPGVQMSLARARKNAIMGAVVVADVVAKSKINGAIADTEALESEILEICRRALARHKVPAAIRFVPSLGVASSGKLARLDA